MALPPPTSSAAALVTGASSGIGAELARELARRGHGLILVARRERRLRELADELTAAHSVRAEPLAADLADPTGRDRLAAAVAELGLAVEVLANNAGFGSYASFADSDRERQIEMIRVNVEALTDLAARYLPPMLDDGRGAIINVASTAAFQPMPGSATYAATKAFVLSFGEAIAEEARGGGVSVTTVCPGPVRTEFSDVAGTSVLAERAPEPVWTSAERVARDAIAGAAAGKRVVVPGSLNRIGALAGQHAPRSALLPLVRNLWARGG